jgi:hypothetical protein
MFHEVLPAEEQFDVRLEDLEWVRFGGEEPVMNNKEACGGPGWEGVAEVFPDADFYHKGGRVSGYRLDLIYVDDVASDTRYVTTLVTDSTANGPVAVLSEAFARMVRTPDRYVWLDYLRDYVNPVVAYATVYSESPGRVAMYVKDYQEDAYDPRGWTLLPGTEREVPAGWSEHEVASECLDWSRQVHIRGRLWADDDVEEDFADSNLHYVIVDGDVACP